MATEPNTPAAAEAGNNFVAVLQNLSRGSAVGEFSDELRRLIEQIQQTEKRGTFILRLNLTPRPNTEGQEIEIAYEVTVKAPKPGRVNSIFFATDEHDLVRNDPRQKEFAFGVVNGTAPAAQPVRQEATAAR